MYIYIYMHIYVYTDGIRLYEIYISPDIIILIYVTIIIRSEKRTIRR